MRTFKSEEEMKEIEGFKDWYRKANKDSIGSVGLESCWNYQQAKIDKLEQEKRLEEKSHNYHCKESQRKNDVINELEQKLKRCQEVFYDLYEDELDSDENSFFMFVEKEFPEKWDKLNAKSEASQLSLSPEKVIRVIERCNLPGFCITPITADRFLEMTKKDIQEILKPEPEFVEVVRYLPVLKEGEGCCVGTVLFKAWEQVMKYPQAIGYKEVKVWIIEDEV